MPGTNITDTNNTSLVTKDTISITDTKTSLGLKNLIIDKYINKLNDEEITDKYGISRMTMYRRLRTDKANDIRLAMVPQQYKRLHISTWIDVINDVAPLIKEKVARVKAGEKVSLSEIATSMAIATDKIQLLTGQVTEIHGYADMDKSLAEIQAEKQALMTELGFDPDDEEQVIDAEIVATAPGDEDA